MDFSLLILQAPAKGPACASALRFAQAAVLAGHRIRQVFFHGDGTAALHQAGAEQASAVEAAWRAFGAHQGIPLLACSSAAQRRGLADADGHVAPGAQGIASLGSLGQLMVALDESERLLTFAG